MTRTSEGACLDSSANTICHSSCALATVSSGRRVSGVPRSLQYASFAQLADSVTDAVFAGQGAHGAVVKAQWRSGCTVAVKWLVSGAAEVPAAVLEALLARMMAHPYLVQTFEAAICRLEDGWDSAELRCGGGGGGGASRSASGAGGSGGGARGSGDFHTSSGSAVLPTAPELPPAAAVVATTATAAAAGTAAAAASGQDTFLQQEQRLLQQLAVRGAADSFEGGHQQRVLAAPRQVDCCGVLRQLGAAAGKYVVQIVSEWCDEGTLHAAIRRGVFRPGPGRSRTWALRALLRTAREVALGMCHLHSLGVIHGDLKPGNVLLKSSRVDSRGFVAKVADFGLSRLLRGPQEEFVATSEWGTVPYMAGEYLDNRLCRSSDVYSFGVLLWQMYTGKAPFAGHLEAQVAVGVLMGTLALEWPPGMPPPLLRLGQACCRHEPEQRPTFKEVAVALAGIETEIKQLHVAAKARYAERVWLPAATAAAAAGGAPLPVQPAAHQAVTGYQSAVFPDQQRCAQAAEPQACHAHTADPDGRAYAWGPAAVDAVVAADTTPSPQLRRLASLSRPTGHSTAGASLPPRSCTDGGCPPAPTEGADVSYQALPAWLSAIGGCESGPGPGATGLYPTDTTASGLPLMAVSAPLPMPAAVVPAAVVPEDEQPVWATGLPSISDDWASGVVMMVPRSPFTSGTGDAGSPTFRVAARALGPHRNPSAEVACPQGSRGPRSQSRGATPEAWSFVAATQTHIWQPPPSYGAGAGAGAQCGAPPPPLPAYGPAACEVWGGAAPGLEAHMGARGASGGSFAVSTAAAAAVSVDRSIATAAARPAAAPPATAAIADSGLGAAAATSTLLPRTSARASTGSSSSLPSVSINSAAAAVATAADTSLRSWCRAGRSLLGRSSSLGDQDSGSLPSPAAAQQAQRRDRPLERWQLPEGKPAPRDCEGGSQPLPTVASAATATTISPVPHAITGTTRVRQSWTSAPSRPCGTLPDRAPFWPGEGGRSGAALGPRARTLQRARAPPSPFQQPPACPASPADWALQFGPSEGNERKRLVALGSASACGTGSGAGSGAGSGGSRGYGDSAGHGGSDHGGGLEGFRSPSSFPSPPMSRLGSRRASLGVLLQLVPEDDDGAVSGGGDGHVGACVGSEETKPRGGPECRVYYGGEAYIQSAPSRVPSASVLRR